MVEAHEGSKTAILVAGYRARATESGIAGCDDPWAGSLVGKEGIALTRRWDAHSPHMEMWIALRTRAIDDAVNAQLDAGVRQVVVLGAGLDTRAARLARDGVAFFEIDHPATQAHKRARLSALDGYPVDAAVYVACDFEHEDFVDQVVSAGLDATAPACVIWEGVVYYLEESAGRATLTSIAKRFAPSSVLIFDLLSSNMARRSESLRAEDRAMLDIVEELGEPMKSGIDDPTPLLFACGFRKLRTMSFDELALQYTGTYDRSRYFRFQSIALVSASEHASLGL